MRIWSCKLMKENQLSRPTKFFLTVGLLLFLVISGASALQNATHGVVNQPRAFSIVLIGFACFVFAKLSVIRHKKLLSIGTRLMTEDQANFYRIGYYLMGLGFIFTFA